ncbi:aspartate aminotransferase, cytoplasmic-like [Diadema antillarum]|uniref:aspartate aminotransferase, cytoplasmic-like n=1 Tax=Diadema antillarum TaxID=105358 RepID=UPI003A8BA9FC
MDDQVKKPRIGQSVFASIEQAPPVAVFKLMEIFKNDPHPNKVNLGPGTYRTDESKPWVLPVVRKVEQEMAADLTLDHEYLPIAGLAEFTSVSTRLILGDDSPAIKENRWLGFQALSGTGAIRLGCEFLSKKANYKVIYVPEPTWPNHIGIANNTDFEVRKYRYYHESTRGLDIEGMLEDLKGASNDSVIILHACAHNPTGVDASREDWKRIAAAIKESGAFPFFDCAYIGFATGNVDTDRWPIQYFVDQGFEFFGAQSYSKNFGLYNERVGNLAVVVNDPDTKPRIKSQLEKLARCLWSNPPNHGARIVAMVLSNPSRYQEWEGHIKTMSNRIVAMRDLLYSKLKELGTPGTWTHIINQIGMFSYTGLGPKQMDFLKEKYHIYGMRTGRINMCAITTKNCDYVAKAIHEAVTTIAEDPKL